MTFRATDEALQSDTVRITFSDDGGTLSFRQVFDLLQSSEEFADTITEALVRSPFGGFFWEVHPVTTRTQDHTFECVIVHGSILTRLRPDASAFSEHFDVLEANRTVTTFRNLGGDATLVVPAPLRRSIGHYAHLASFLREGEGDQIREFWRAVGTACLAQISESPFWLSTAGLGVSWLHLRLDSRPKYYRHPTYKSACVENS